MTRGSPRGREFENLIMDCCQLEDSVQPVKREETGGNDPENGSPDADRGSRGPGNQPQDPHRSPPDLEDGSSEGPGDQHGGRHLDQVTQLHADQVGHIREQSNQDVCKVGHIREQSNQDICKVGHIREQSSQDVCKVGHIRKQSNQDVCKLGLRGLRKVPSSDKDATVAPRRGLKRKLPEEESSCSSEEDDDEEEDHHDASRSRVKVTHRGVVLSPASSSSHSSTTVPLGALSPKPNITVTTAPHEDSEGVLLPQGGTSVKDLEHAMSKHLPCKTPPHQPTDFSTDALLKQQQQRSTIQWIGAHHHLSHLNPHQNNSAPLPASALLRQLYANRESVIRANVHVGPRGSWDQVGPLPTPPGSEGSSTYGEHQFLKASNNTADAFNSLVSSYSTSGGGGGYSGVGVDYHSAMTPPSSVSPRDKHQQQLHPTAAFEGAVYSDVLRHQYLGAETPAQPLPLKPQVYSAVHPGALDAAAYAASTSLDQSQFYHHSATGGGFHLYHPANKTVTATGTVYPESLKNSANWYSSAS
uniref:Uncharacterized protein n=1 Tax=Timema bartmani TaxID=61472 RepID=A0A7R9I1M5_9NEOP|nr:unnamed protein product [Timema bartmani]